VVLGSGTVAQIDRLRLKVANEQWRIFSVPGNVSFGAVLAFVAPGFVYALTVAANGTGSQ
jgi:hypothetical protein